MEKKAEACWERPAAVFARLGYIRAPCGATNNIELLCERNSPEASHSVLSQNTRTSTFCETPIGLVNLEALVTAVLEEPLIVSIVCIQDVPEQHTRRTIRDGILEACERTDTCCA